MKCIIKFKTKLMNCDNKKCFYLKKEYNRHNIENIIECISHWGINSTLMPQIIKKGILKTINRDNLNNLVYIDSLPENITVEEGFLSVVRIIIEI